MEIKSKEVSIVDIDSIHPWEENANDHPDDQIDALGEIIKFNGFRNPLLVESGTNDIVAGCGRWIAAKKIGLKQIPVIFQTYESYDHKYSHMVADNAIASRAILNLAKINMSIPNLGPDFNIDHLGILDFKIDPLEVDFPDLSGKDPDFQQRTFILSNEQNDFLNEAMKKAKSVEDCSDEINKNENGNVLAAIMKAYVNR